MNCYWRGCVIALMLALASGAHGQTVHPAAGAIPYKEENSMAGALWRAGLGLLGLAGIVVALMYGYKRIPRLTGHTSSKRLKVVESVRLSPRTTLLLVEMDCKTMLLSTNGQETQVLVPPERSCVNPNSDIAS